MDAADKAMASGQEENQQQQQNLQQQQSQNVTLQLSYQDSLKVRHPDITTPFASLEDACERLLPFHLLADYEPEEGDKILDSASASTSKPTPILSRSQQWDSSIAAQMAEYTNTFEKQVQAFNMMTRKRALGEFRTEEKLMVEHLLLQDERQKFFELRAQIADKRQRVHEAAFEHMGEMMGRGPVRGSSSGSFGADGGSGGDNDLFWPPHLGEIRGSSSGSFGGGGGSGCDNNVFGPPHLGEQDQGEFNEEDTVKGWGGDVFGPPLMGKQDQEEFHEDDTVNRLGGGVNKDDDKEPSQNFLNDEAENGSDGDGDDSASHGGGGGSGELDLNAK